MTPKTVAQRMRPQGVRSRGVRRYQATTDSGHGGPGSANVLNPTLRATRPHPVWMTDITYIATQEGGLYRASVEDLDTRKIVGGATDARMTPDRTVRALDHAYRRQRPPAGFLPHSDRGSP